MCPRWPTSCAPRAARRALLGCRPPPEPRSHRPAPVRHTRYAHHPRRDADDIQHSLRSLVAAGAPVEQDPRDVGGGKLIARLRDADGNPIGLAQSPA
jgi:predicted enzyme related to lactoylglutathione lyase